MYLKRVLFPAMKSSKNQATTGQVTSAFIAIAVIIGASVFVWLRMQNQNKQEKTSQPTQVEGQPTAIPTPTPTPTKLFHGKDTYIVSRGSQATGPNISEITFDPLDPAVGAKQTISAKVSHNIPLTEVTLKLRTDSKTTTLTLSRVEGTELGGTWQTSWTVPESYLYNYAATIAAKAGKEETSIPIIIRERK